MEQIMKKLLFLSIIIWAASCGPSVKFLKTGNTYPPLAQNVDVIVYIEEQPKNFETIGYAKMIGPEFKFDEITIRIKEQARSVGGDIVIFEKKTLLGLAVQGNAAALMYEFRFRIAKTKTTNLKI